MPKHRKITLFLCLALVLLVPLGMLIYSLFSQNGEDMARFAHYEYFALTDTAGGEYIYRPTDAVFARAARAFSEAVPIDSPPTARDAHITLEWIEGGRADRYTLAYTPDFSSAILTDRKGTTYLLAEEDAFYFLADAAGCTLLVGEDPPTLTLGNSKITPAVLEWVVSLADKNGAAQEFSSGEYRTEAPTYTLTPADFAPHFAEAPERAFFALFRGEEALGEFSEPPNLAALPVGDYQLVLVAEWETGIFTARAGYSFAFSIA